MFYAQTWLAYWMLNFFFFYIATYIFLSFVEYPIVYVIGKLGPRANKFRLRLDFLFIVVLVHMYNLASIGYLL